MKKLMDFIDDYVFGPLDLITRAERIIKQRVYRDAAIKFSILQIKRGGIHTQNDVKRILEPYGIYPFAWTCDSRHIHFFIKGRQANWAEYLLLHAQVQLQNPLINPKNLEYVRQHPPGWMPPRWVDHENLDDERNLLDKVEPDAIEQFYQDELNNYQSLDAIASNEEPLDHNFDDVDDEEFDDTEFNNRDQSLGFRNKLDQINNWLDYN